MRLKPPCTLPFSASLLALLAMHAIPATARPWSGNTLPAPTGTRITEALNPNTLVTLRGNTHPLAQPRYDQGALSTGVAAGKLLLLLKRSPAQQIALGQYLDSVQNPHSPNYHKWLTPQQYGTRFGVADEDLATVENWLESEGFTVENVPSSRNLIQFSGTVGQVEQAFHTSIHSYIVNGVQHHGNSTDPEIPAALAPVIAGLSPLNDFRAVPQDIVNTHSTVQRSNGGGLQVLSETRGATPLIADTTATTLYVTPANAATIYDSPNTFNARYTGSSQETGLGVNIGIAGYSDLATADYLNYRKLFLHEVTPLIPTTVVDGPDPGVLDQHDGQETLTDTEIAAAMAPGANIYVYSSQSDLLQDGLTDAIVRAIEDNNVAVLNVSYTNCEASLGASGNLEFNELWQEAAAQGISVVVAAGDTGTAACDDGTESAATGGLAVSGMASTPYDTAVGGTDFDILGTNFAQYVNNANNVDTAASQASTSGYIPENPWNDSISNNPPGSYTADTPTIYNYGDGPTSIILAGGGGASSLAYCAAGIDQSTGYCLGPLAGYPAPPFQSGIHVGNAATAGVRYIPDVALFAGTNRQYPDTWALCSDNLVGQADYTFVDCSPAADGTFSVEGAGGTATSAAAFSGVLGMVLQSLGSNVRLGVANNVLYNLYGVSSDRAAAFHDVTAGNNAVPCAAGTALCGTNGFLNGYDAGPGYDLASGLGSVDVDALIAAWPTAVFTPTTTTLQVDGSVAPVTITHGTTVTLSATVAPADATGTVAVIGTGGQGGAAVSDYIPLTDGQGSIESNNLPGGKYTIQGYYAGDVTHSPSTSTPQIQLTVGPEDSTLLLSLDVADVNTSQEYANSFPYGSYGFVYVQPTNATASTEGPDGIATGTVALLNNGNSLGAQSLDSKGIAAFPLEAFAPGTYVLGASYSGDQSYNSSQTTVGTQITILKGPTQLTAVSEPAIVNPSSSTIITVTLETDSTGPFPTGAITLAANGRSFTGNVEQVRTTINSDEEIATFAISGDGLASGPNTLTATYPGDPNYGSSSTTAVVTLTGNGVGSQAFTLTGPSGGITVSAPGTPATGIVTVNPTNGFTGAVSLSCTLTATTAGNAPTCTVTPSVTLTSSAPAIATVTINTVATAASLIPTGKQGSRSPASSRWMGAGIAFGSVLLFLAPARRRALLSVLIAVVAIGVVAAGCGVTPAPKTQVATYTATITGTSGSTVASTQVAVTVR